MLTSARVRLECTLTQTGTQITYSLTDAPHTHMRAHARTHARTHAHPHARTHAHTHTQCTDEVGPAEAVDSEDGGHLHSARVRLECTPTQTGTCIHLEVDQRRSAQGVTMTVYHISNL